MDSLVFLIIVHTLHAPEIFWKDDSIGRFAPDVHCYLDTLHGQTHSDSGSSRGCAALTHSDSEEWN